MIWARQATTGRQSHSPCTVELFFISDNYFVYVLSRWPALLFPCHFSCCGPLFASSSSPPAPGSSSRPVSLQQLSIFPREKALLGEGTMMGRAPLHVPAYRLITVWGEMTPGDRVIAPRNKCLGAQGGVMDEACVSLLPEDLINPGKLPRHQSVYLFTTLKVIYLTFENGTHTSCRKQRTLRHKCNCQEGEVSSWQYFITVLRI